MVPMSLFSSLFLFICSTYLSVFPFFWVVLTKYEIHPYDESLLPAGDFFMLQLSCCSGIGARFDPVGWWSSIFQPYQYFTHMYHIVICMYVWFSIFVLFKYEVSQWQTSAGTVSWGFFKPLLKACQEWNWCGKKLSICQTLLYSRYFQEIWYSRLTPAITVARSGPNSVYPVFYI